RRRRHAHRLLAAVKRASALFAAFVLLGSEGTDVARAFQARVGGPERAALRIIKLGRLVDGTGRVTSNAVVRVENDRIQSVTTGDASIPSGAEVIDLSRFTGIPGLID